VLNRILKLITLYFLGYTTLFAQDLEPRTYANVPVGLNFVVAGTAYNTGSVLFDPTVPLENAKIKINSFVFAYARTLKLGNMTGKFDVVVPYVLLEGSATYKGQEVYRDVTGLGDSKLSFSVNFIGAPPLSIAGFKDYKEKLVVGGRMQVYLPLSQYDPSRLVNIGTNRFAFKPELGISKKFGRVFLETAVGAAFFTTNTNYNKGLTLIQSPIGYVQAHAIYTLPKHIWFAFDATFYWGGATTVNEIKGDNLQANSRIGFTCATPISKRQSLKLNLSTGVYTRTGTDFNTILLVWQYRWGRDLKKTKPNETISK
jgi:hypothetical protein